ncbi:hypothetical protein P43SY_011787 [Pythium insidiosum]|uniref:Uncharacterized protein n=1 Tax=Pythium insidiosum TaxID=114742 RepID=A0AAD5LRT0_PYTIN|nr:hypothetical protein P43SY_011787 [Pythium insidiosum]
MTTKPETEAVVEPVDIESSAELTWKDVVYSQPLALTIRRCGGEIWRVHLSREPFDRDAPHVLSKNDSFVHVFSAGELISQVIWFYDTPVNETHLVVVGICVRTNRGATLSVGSLVGAKRVCVAPTGKFIHGLELSGRPSTAVATVIVSVAPLQWLRPHPLKADSSVYCGELAGKQTQAAFHVRREEIAALIFEIEHESSYVTGIHVLDKLELETISALELDRNLHLFVLQNEEQITTVEVKTWSGYIACVKVGTSQRQSPWYGSVCTYQPVVSLWTPTRGDGKPRVCGFHGTLDGGRVTSLGIVAKPSPKTT